LKPRAGLKEIGSQLNQQVGAGERGTYIDKSSQNVFGQQPVNA
jgi:hypothetical protein